MGGWGYKIDYAAAIRDDEATIAALTEEIAHGWYQVELPTSNPDFPTWTAVTLRDVVFHVPGAAARAGLTPTDVADLAWYCEIDPARLVAAHGDLPEETKGRFGYDRGKDLAARLDRVLQKDEATAKRALQRAKASLARHRRNQLEYGRSKGGTP